MTPVVVLALVASLLYGASDFLGALSARRLTVVKASTAIYAAATTVGALALALFPWTYSNLAFWAGTIAGLFAIVGMVAFYAALAIGPMSLLAPLIALIQTAVPVIVAALTGQTLSLVAWIAVAVALVATTLISIPAGAVSAKPDEGGRRIGRITPRGGVLALVSGVTLGLSVVALDTAPADSGVFPAFLDIAVGLVVLLPLLAVPGIRASDAWLRGGGTAPSTPQPDATPAQAVPLGTRTWAASALAGTLLGIGNILLVLALHSGNLAIVAVLMGLYPVGTVVLARLVLKEHMSILQLLGVGLAILAAILLGTA